MAFSFGTPTSNDNNDFNTTTITVDKPSGVVDGDLMLTFLWSPDDGTNSVTTLSGWTLIGSQGDVSSANMMINAFFKVAGGSEPADYTWTQANTVRFGAVCVKLTGADTADVLDVVTFGADTGFDTDVVCPSVTATDDDGLLVTMHGATGGRPYSPPGGHTELFDVYPDFGSDGGICGAIGYETLSSSGATGTRTWTRSGSDRDVVGSFIINATAVPVAAAAAGWGRIPIGGG